MIYGNRIRLRGPERSDIPMFVRWFNDAEVTAGLLMVLPMTQAAEEDWFDGLSKRDPYERPMVIEARQGDDWKAIGNCGYHNLDWRVRSAELGIVLGEKEYWNQGYGAETMQLLLDFGFRTINLNRIWLRVFSNNPRAIHCYEKVGFVHEGRLRQANYKDGQYVDELIMGVLRGEWSGG
jgi:RimJ/RimL family protein N-acetyltransferase